MFMHLLFSSEFFDVHHIGEPVLPCADGAASAGVEGVDSIDSGGEEGVGKRTSVVAAVSPGGEGMSADCDEPCLMTTA